MITVTINNKQYHIRTSLMEITLQQRLDWDIQYGGYFKKQLEDILKIEDELAKEIDYYAYTIELAVKTISFFNDIPLDVVENCDLNQVLALYHTSIYLMSEDTDFHNKEIADVTHVQWNGQDWEIQPPFLNNTSEMTAGEFIQAKQIISNVYEIGQQKWQALLPLCCIYLRKKGESYSDALISEEGERMKLMRELPLQHALSVAFFLSDSMNLFMNTFRFSESQEAEVPAST